MRNGFWHQLRRFAARVCFFPLALISFNCINTPLDPVGPTWETQMVTPLSTRSYSVAQLAAKNPTLMASFGPGASAPATVAFATISGHYADTTSLGDSSGSGKVHTLVDSTTARDFTSIKVHVVVDNGIPVDGALRLLFLDGTKRMILTIPQAAGDSVIAPSPTVTGGTVGSPSHVERVLTLSDAEIQLFNKTQWMVYYLQFSAPSTNIPALQPAQTISIRVWAELSYEVNK
jgi:hypothetical protein